MSAPRVAVVTGGGSGIGLATSARLIEDGFTLAVLDLDGDAAKSAAGPAGLGIGVDVADPVGVQTAFGQIAGEFGHIDVLVNNAGISGGPTATRCHETPVEEWDRVQAVNVRGPFLCSSAVLPIMLSQGSGHIITIASVAGGMVVFPKRCAYVASKAAALMLAKSIAIDYAKEGIRSNAVCPALVYTPMTAWRLDNPQFRAAVESQIPIGRIAQVDDIADAISVLASDRLSYMTGSAFVMDGGWTAI